MRPAARLIDLTRSVSRLGRGPMTGVDRVEYVWTRHLLTLETPVYGLVRTALGFVLLDRCGVQGVADRAVGMPLGAPDLIGRMTRRGNPLRGAAEADMRRMALARAPRWELERLLRRHLPAGFSYLNLGHANLDARAMRAIHSVADALIAVLVHDTIPLDHPEFTRPGIGETFGRKLATVSAHADLVIHGAAATRRLTETHLARAGRVPPGITALLGVGLSASPVPIPPSATPYFVTIGTIEPRKNHALLIDVWERMHRERAPEMIPHLHILGRRGWANAGVFARLDSLPFIGQTVFERPDLPDDQVAGLLANSCGLLFPSFAEGFGLPPLEAAALGVPVISAPLPIYREVLGDYPVYVDPSDSYSWMETILRLVEANTNRGGVRMAASRQAAVPGWPNHFNTVLTLV